MYAHLFSVRSKKWRRGGHICFFTPILTLFWQSKGCFVDSLLVDVSSNGQLVENDRFVHNCLSNRPNCFLITRYAKITD